MAAYKQQILGWGKNPERLQLGSGEMVEFVNELQIDSAMLAYKPVRS